MPASNTWNSLPVATLYYSRNPNPRLAVAVARFLRAPVTLEWAATFDPAHSARFRKLNPTLLLPILVEDGRSLWEADAIACRLSMMVKSDFWRMNSDLPDMIRWISWGKANFVQAVDMVHFEYGTKQRYNLGPIDMAMVAEGRERFQRSATQLDAHLEGKDFLLESGLSFADFRMASYLPYNDVAGLPVADYPNVNRWHQRLSLLSAWSDPFEGLDTPELPPLPPRRG